MGDCVGVEECAQLYGPPTISPSRGIPGASTWPRTGPPWRRTRSCAGLGRLRYQVPVQAVLRPL